MPITRHLPCLTLLVLLQLSVSRPVFAGEGAHNQFTGHWRVNLELSDDTDRQVEKAIKAGGGRIPNTGKSGRGRYRGGPEEHAMYDHISYDDMLEFHYSAPEFRLVYDDGYERVFYSDGRRRTVSASGTSKDDAQDFAFASWDGETLLVESRPRDGGWTIETYTLDTETGQLRAQLELNPSSFARSITILRVYDRVQTTD